jgi:hypothetical protein
LQESIEACMYVQLTKKHDMRKVPSKRSLINCHARRSYRRNRMDSAARRTRIPRNADMRNPPFASSLTNIVLGSGGPGVKLCVQDIGPPSYPIQRRILEAKCRAYLGRCRRCRGPLRWYIEDKVALAREFLAKEKRDKLQC